MLATTLLLLVVLLALSVPVAAVMGVLGIALNNSSRHAVAPGHGRDRLEHVERVHPDRHSAVRHARRDPAARGHRREGLQRHRAVALVASRRPHARQHRRLRHVRRDLRLERGHGRHYRHRGHPGDPEAQLQRAPVPRHHRGRRHARHPDPAVDQLHPLRPADQLERCRGSISLASSRVFCWPSCSW